MILLSILWNDILPLVAFIGAGWYLDYRFKIDIGTYTKLTVWVAFPVFMFHIFYQYEAAGMEYLLVPMAAGGLAVQYLLSGLAGRCLHLDSEKNHIFQAVSTFSNTGNIGIALIMMIYTHPPFSDGGMPLLHEALGTMAILMIVMNVAVNVFGAASIRSRGASFAEYLLYLVKMPALYGVLLAVLLRTGGISIQHTFLWPVIEHLNGAFIVLIMVTAGVQFHRTAIKMPEMDILTACALKLLGAPLLAFLLIKGAELAGGLSPLQAQVFFIFSAIPSSVSLIIYSVEYDNHKDFVTRSVFTNAILGAFTVTGAIYLSRLLFPLG